MITGGDLRQSRLDIGYKTFTISPCIKVDIPNEKHDEATKLLIAKYGPATEFKGLGPLQRSMSWKVPGGIILFPPYASMNRDRWSSIIWLADSMMKKS